MDFIYELYKNDNFTLYLTIALVVLVILFVIVLIFGKRDQKLEETKRLQKIELEGFKEEPKKEEKLEVKVEEEKKEEPILALETQDVNVITFKPEIVEEEKKELEDLEKTHLMPLFNDSEEEEKPINIDEIKHVKIDEDVENDLNELQSLKTEIENIELPKTIEEEKSTVKTGTQVFSSVFVNNQEKTEEKPEVAPINIPASNPQTTFMIDCDDDTIELPTLKVDAKKESSPLIQDDTDKPLL